MDGEWTMEGRDGDGDGNGRGWDALRIGIFTVLFLNIFCFIVPESVMIQFFLGDDLYPSVIPNTITLALKIFPEQ